MQIINPNIPLVCKECRGSGWDSIKTMSKDLNGDYVWYHGYCQICDGLGST